MNLRDEENLILAYLEEELPAEERQKFAERLEKDPKLAQLVEQMWRDRQLLRQLPEEAAPERIMEEIRRQLERSMLLEPAEDERRAAGARPHRLGRLLAYVALAAMVAIGAGLIIHTLVLSLRLKPGGSTWSPESQKLAEIKAERKAELANVGTQAQLATDSGKREAEREALVSKESGAPAAESTPLAAKEAATGVGGLEQRTVRETREEKELTEGQGQKTEAETTEAQRERIEKEAREKDTEGEAIQAKTAERKQLEEAKQEKKEEKGTTAAAEKELGKEVEKAGAVAAGRAITPVSPTRAVEEDLGGLIRVLMWTDQAEEAVQRLEGWVAGRGGAVLSDGINGAAVRGEREARPGRRVVVVLRESELGPLLVELNRPANQVAGLVTALEGEEIRDPQEMLRRVREAGVRQWGVQEWQRILLRYESVRGFSRTMNGSREERTESGEKASESGMEGRERRIERYRLVRVEILPEKPNGEGQEDRR